LDVELKFLAFRRAFRVGRLCCGKFPARDGQFGIGIHNTLRKSLELCSQNGNLVVNALELNQVRNRRMHG
jgi:hypothetical protein